MRPSRTGFRASEHEGAHFYCIPGLTFDVTRTAASTHSDITSPSLTHSEDSSVLKSIVAKSAEIVPEDLACQLHGELCTRALTLK